MSDLQCAATLLLLPYDEAGRHASGLAGARIARVWTAPGDQERLAAAALAVELGVAVATSEDLDGPEPSDAALGAIADEHRGETVVVVVERGAAATEVAIDGDGTARRPWPR